MLRTPTRYGSMRGAAEMLFMLVHPHMPKGEQDYQDFQLIETQHQDGRTEFWQILNQQRIWGREGRDPTSGSGEEPPGEPCFEFVIEWPNGHENIGREYAIEVLTERMFRVSMRA